MRRGCAVMVVVCEIALLATADRAAAQVPQRGPRIGYVYPAGGQQGTTVKVTLGGQFLDGASALVVSDGGVEGKGLEHSKPLNAMQINKLREQLKELQERRAAARPAGKAAKKATSAKADAANAKTAPPRWTADDDKRLEELRRKLAGAIRRPLNPMLAEQVVVELSIAADAKPGDRELRLKTSQGLTNPLMFCVGKLPERSEKDPAAKPPSTKPAKAKPGPGRSDPEAVTDVELPVTVNGQILPGGVDRFRFTAKKGQRLVAIAQARRLIPYLADAVPGWFQATLALFDSEGRELAYDDDFRFQPDPVLAYVIPADGRYTIEIKDAIYRGREDFVYRITLGELPLATVLYPLGGPVGKKTHVQVGGWNLPDATRVLEGTPKTPGIYPLPVGGEPWISQRLPFAADTLPECFEKEPNDSAAEAQAVTTPIIVNGRIGKANDIDVFRFEGKTGQTVVAEVYARRLNSPLDSTISLKDSSGRTVAANDDHEDRAFGLLTHHADSWLQAKLPADGAYTLHLTDAQHRGGPEYGYRLRISPPRPDFELRVVPSSVNTRAGSTVPVRVYALRRDGFDGPINLELENPPRGFSLGGGRVPAGQSEVRVTLTVPGVPDQEIFDLRMTGRATIGGVQRVQSVVPADDLMQAFAYHHLVPAQEWKVAVLGVGRGRAFIRLAEKEPVKIRRGGTAKVHFTGGIAMLERVDLELSDPPEGVSIQEATIADRGIELVLRADAAKSKGPAAGNLIVVAYLKRDLALAKAKSKAKAKMANLRGAPITALPAVPFELAEE